MKTETIVAFRVKGPDITDKCQKSGRLAPVFPSILQDDKRHEEYIARMILRDKTANFG